MLLKKFLSLVIVCSICFQITTAIASENALEISAPSALLMDYTTGEIIYEKNPHEKKPMASVTKIMTMLLGMEEIKAGNLSYDDMITGSAHAKSYGGSTIFLDEGEQMTVRDIFKGIAVASGNDAAVALGEHISGTESVFVDRMNKKAEELGMTNTHFVNCNGLDADGHYSTAYDIALMSRELMKYDDIFEFTGIWMDSLRGGEFTLSNTNKLIRFYDGATGLKTGSTDDAKFCISATAKRDNMHLICVIMGAETSKKRQADASSLLNYGFSNYKITDCIKENDEIKDVKIEKGQKKSVKLRASEGFSYLTEKKEKIEPEIIIENSKKIMAPIKSGDVLGTIIVKLNGKESKKINLICTENISRVTFSQVFKALLKDWIY